MNKFCKYAYEKMENKKNIIITNSLCKIRHELLPTVYINPRTLWTDNELSIFLLVLCIMNELTIVYYY
jgi:hypothetical protein